MYPLKFIFFIYMIIFNPDPNHIIENHHSNLKHITFWIISSLLFPNTS